MDISATRVKELRDLSGAGVMDCRRALEEGEGSIERALEILRAHGLAQSARREAHETNQGLIEAYVHGDGRIGVLVEVQCETDFVARTPEFRQLAHDLALQIAAFNPPSVDGEATSPAAELEETPLLNQPFVKDPGQTVRDVVQEVASKTREKVVVRRFTRYQTGS
ncbi:MAG TPA: elongation factor Ts [Chloroflexota bacterium]